MKIMMAYSNSFSRSDAAVVRTMPSYTSRPTVDSWTSSTAARSWNMFESGESEFAAVTIAEKVAEERERRRQPLSIRQALCRNGRGGRGGPGGGQDWTTASLTFQELLAKAVDARAARVSALSTDADSVRRSEEQGRGAATSEGEAREVVGSSRVMHQSERQRKNLQSKSQVDVTHKDEPQRARRRLFRALGRKGRRRNRAPSPGRRADQLVEQACGRRLRRRSLSPAQRNEKADGGGRGT